MRRLTALVLACLLAGCNETDTATEAAMNDKHPTIHLEMQQPIQSLLDESPVPFAADCLKAVDVCVYEHDRSVDDPNLPSVVMGDLFLERVMTVSIFNDESLGHSIQKLDLTLFGEPSDSPHEQNHAFAYALIDKLKKAGWQHYYFPTDPRIPGTQADKVSPPGQEVGSLSHAWFDPDYQMSLERWLLVGSFYHWFFHKDGVYLQLDAWRNDAREAPQERGTYLFSLRFQTATDQWRDSFPEDQRTRWIELMPAELEKYAKLREAAETKARAAGITIDEDYRDPPIPGVTP